MTETGSFPAPRWPASASVRLLFSGCLASQPPGTEETQGLALDSPLASGSTGLAWSPSRPPGLSPREQRVCLLCSQPCAPWRSTFQLLRELPLCTHSSAKRLGQRPSVRPVSALDVPSSLSSVVSKAITRKTRDSSFHLKTQRLLSGSQLARFQYRRASGSREAEVGGERGAVRPHVAPIDCAHCLGQLWFPEPQNSYSNNIKDYCLRSPYQVSR